MHLGGTTGIHKMLRGLGSTVGVGELEGQWGDSKSSGPPQGDQGGLGCVGDSQNSP